MHSLAITWTYYDLCLANYFINSLSSERCKSSLTSVHWNINVVILMKFSSLAALKVVILTTFNAASGENFVETTTFLFQCIFQNLPVKLVLSEGHITPLITLLITSQHWFTKWRGAVRQEAITWTSVWPKSPMPYWSRRPTKYHTDPDAIRVTSPQWVNKLSLHFKCKSFHYNADYYNTTLPSQLNNDSKVDCCVPFYWGI